MQSTAVKTPASSKKEGDAAKKATGKKLVQARLPFKIIPSGTPAAATASSAETKELENSTKDGRKRKLSFEVEKEDKEKTENSDSDALRGRSASKENLTVSAKKKKTAVADDDVILLDDDSVEGDDDDNNVKALEDGKDISVKEKEPVEKQNTKMPIAKPTPKSVNKTSAKKATKALSSPRTPRPRGAKETDADTPKSTKAKNSTTPGSAKNQTSNNKSSAGSSATKVQIKIPLGSVKSNKRRKSKILVHSDDEEVIVSSDDNAGNPVKKQKVVADIPKDDKKAEVLSNLDSDKTSVSTHNDAVSIESEESSNVLVLEIGGNETDLVDSELDSRCSSVIINSKDTTPERGSKNATTNKTEENSSKEQPDKDTKKVYPKHDSKSDDECKPVENVGTGLEHNSSTKNDQKANIKSAKPQKTPDKKLKTKKNESPAKATQTKNVKKSPENSSKRDRSPTDDSRDKNIETRGDDSVVVNSSSDSEQSSSSARDESKSYAEESTSKIDATPKHVKDDNNSISKKTLTPKQIKLMEQRRKAREEKERRLQEERMQKQREKEAKELLKKQEREEREEQRRKEREERDEQKRKEREERDEQKRKEREEKEKKRMAEQEAKNEEKRKRNEAKEEELQKKEEERKRKEAADLKAKKEAEAFQKFFKAKRTLNTDADTNQQQTEPTGDYVPEMLAFRPFEVKGDMKMAPLRRKQLIPAARHKLEVCVGTDKEATLQSSDLYLAELKSGKITPGIWRRISVDTKASDDDVQIIDDELDRAGQAIVEETHVPIEHFRAKFYKFHENRRPPYYGTWRKRTNVINPRRPFVQDTKFFDYEVDSDLEWEEEEPGESLDGSDDEKEKESEDDDYEVDNEWFVPHGHLSEEELQNEDEVLDANTREAQKAKLQVLQREFAQEMKKKTEKIKPRLIGCIWTDENGNQPTLCPKIIWDTLNMRAMLCQGPPLLEDPEVPDKSEPGSPTSNGNEKTTEKIKPIKINERMLNDLVRLVHGNRHSKNFLIKEFIAYLEANEESIKNGEVRGPIKSIVREKIDEFAEWTITEATKITQNNKKKNKKHLCWIVSADVLKKMGLEDLGLQNTWKYTLQPKIADKDESTKPEVEAQTESVPKETPAIAVVEDKLKECEPPTPKNKMKNSAKEKSVASSHKKEKKAKSHTEITKFAKVLSPKSPKTQQKVIPKSSTVESQPATSETTSTSSSPATPKPAANVKKRVPLLMSVARGQNIPEPAKNALISEFLKKSSPKSETGSSKTAQSATTSTANEVSEVVELD
uniref:Chromatin assembly factor 1 subunit A n=1 Tax=Ceratitis capitata TaxID=7213 RepID=W8C4T6_CERCA